MKYYIIAEATLAVEGEFDDAAEAARVLAEQIIGRTDAWDVETEIRDEHFRLVVDAVAPVD